MSIRERLFLRRLCERDESAFREMVEQYQNQVFNITYRMMGSRAEAEDLAQEVFVTVFKTVDRFRGESKFSTWLYRVTVNHCKNRIKYLARRRQLATSSFDEATERASLAQSGHALAASRYEPPDRALEGLERDLVVQKAIAELDEDHREVVVLRDVQELSYEEVCAITGLPEGTVKSRLHRARAALKEKLKKY